MDPVAFSLALGILTFVLSYSCFGVDGALSFVTAVGTTIAMWLGQRSASHEERSREDDVAPRSVQKRANLERSGRNRSHA
jgi:hypothetical protein